ncbi:MAG: hypothetical protein U0R17_00035 [Acidimicrobiia bacterium]
MNKIRAIPIAKALTGSKWGVDHLSKQTRSGKIPGFTIPAEIVEQATGIPSQNWSAIEDVSPFYEIPSAMLGGLARPIFGVSPSQDWNGSHLHTPHSPLFEFHIDGSRVSDLAVHIQGECEGDRRVVLGDQRQEFEYIWRLKPKLTDEEILEVLEEHFPGRSFWFGTTSLGVATVFSNVDQQRTPHVFFGEGTWSRFNGPDPKHSTRGNHHQRELSRQL